MITKYMTYYKECPTEEMTGTEFEFVYPELEEEHDSMSHQLVNVTISDNKIYYTFRLEIRLKGVIYLNPVGEDEEVSPYER